MNKKASKALRKKAQYNVSNFKTYYCSVDDEAKRLKEIYKAVKQKKPLLNKGKELYDAWMPYEEYRVPEEQMNKIEASMIPEWITEFCKKQNPKQK